VMEYDPKVRGGEKDENGERHCYRIAEEILSTKVVHVFCVNCCKLLSFKINETDTVKLLEEEISILVPEYQEFTLLLADGAILHSNTSLLDCYNQRGDSEWLIYAINPTQLVQLVTSRRGSSTGQLALSNIYQELPDNIREMVESPEVPRNHMERKRLWGCAFHYINEIAKTFRRLVQAQRAVMITLMRCNSELMQKKEDMTAEAYRLAASVDLFVLSCENDLHHFSCTGFSEMPGHEEYPEKLKGMIEEAKSYQVSIIEEVSTRVTTAQRELVKLKNNPLLGNQDSELDQISKLAKSQYETLLKTERTTSDPMDSQYMAKLTLQVLAVWERSESNFVRQLGNVVNCKSQMESLIAEVENVILKLKKYGKNIREAMKWKQEMTWNILTRRSLSFPTMRSGPMTYELTSILEEVDNVPLDPQSLIDESHGALERLGNIVEGFREPAEERRMPEQIRRQSADAVMENRVERMRESYSQRRTVSEGIAKASD